MWANSSSASFSSDHNSKHNFMLLPPPASLDIVAIGPTWAKLTWPTVAGAASYNVITRDVSNGNIVDNQTISSINPPQATVLGLVAGVTYQSEIRTIDSNGEQSESATYSDDYQAIVIELVGSGFSVPFGLSNGPCTVGFNLSDACDYNWAPSNFTYF